MQMLHKITNNFVEVYHFFQDETALVYSDSVPQFQQNGGWQKIPIKELYPITKKEYEKKLSNYQQQYSKIEGRLLKLSENIFVTSDSLTFDNKELAIKHEMTLL